MTTRRRCLLGLLALSACGSPGDQLRDPTASEFPPAAPARGVGATGADGEIDLDGVAAQRASRGAAESEQAKADLHARATAGTEGSAEAFAAPAPHEETPAAGDAREGPQTVSARGRARGCEGTSEFEAKLSPELRARIQRHQALVRRAAEESEVDVDLLNAICYLESKFDARARRGKNKGLMQLGPGATASMAEQLHLRAAPYDPNFALRAGARLLSRLIARYDGSVEWALVAYQRGVGGAAKIFVPGPVPNGQRSYVDRVLALRDDFSQSRWGGRCLDPAVPPS